jgi:ABC-2 type transport system ATP-binding protein
VNVIEATNLGKRYRSRWAIRECSISIPEGHVVALVGPNGAGKTTLLHCAVGLTKPTTGDVKVFGELFAGSPAALERIAFVAQDVPLHKYLSVHSTIELTRNLNRSFDTSLARERLDDLGIGLEQRVGKLSGGQQSQLALALALARHPDLLVLDEPLARLDPLARSEFMSVVMRAVAEEGLSVVLSSHVVSELERVASYLIVLNVGRVQIASDIDSVTEGHALLTGPLDDVEQVSKSFDVVQTSHGDRQARLLVRTNGFAEMGPRWESSSVSLEEVILAYLRDPESSAISSPMGAGSSQIREVRT